jgi:hypothetical protein
MPPVPPPKRHPYDQWVPDARALDLVGDKWTLLIVRDLAAGPRRFVELQRVLPGISTEQLRSRLNLMPVLGALAAWGYEWAWGRPREGEAIDIGAILRLAPGLVRLPGSTSGTVACVVEDADRRDYALVVDRGRVTIEEREAPDAEATLSGTQRAWIDAFAPDGSLQALKIEGNRELAEAVLTALRNETARQAVAAA